MRQLVRGVRRRSVGLATTALVLSLTMVLPASATAPVVRTPVAASNTGGLATVADVSCATVCAAVGSYENGGASKPFVSVLSSGNWTDTPIGTTGVGVAVTCPSDGTCEAAGTTTAGAVWFSVFQNALWTTTYPSLASGNQGLRVTSLSCSSASRCVVGLSELTSSGAYNAGVALLSASQWHFSVVAASSNTAGDAATTSVSCASDGSCAAVGYALTQSGNEVGFFSLVASSSTAWADSAVGSDLTTTGNVELTALSCVSATACTMGGNFVDDSNNQQAFVGQWNGTAVSDTAIATSLNTGHVATVSSVSCPFAGGCTAAGTYAGTNGVTLGFSAQVSNGSWGATSLGGDLSGASGVTISSLACLGLASCVAGGTFIDSSGSRQGVVAVYNGTTWTSTPVFTSLNVDGYAAINAVACGSALCVAGGRYADAQNNQQAATDVLALAPATSLSATATSPAQVGTSVTVSVHGSSGSTTPVLTATGTGCTVSGQTVQASQATSCVVTVTVPANGLTMVSSTTVTIVFSLKAQAPLSLVIPKTKLILGSAMTVQAVGGSGTGAVHFVATGGCTVSGAVVRATKVGPCSLYAQKAPSGIYAAATSPKMTLTIVK